jgi:hypothetical protein
MPSCPTSTHADSPSIREYPVTSGGQSLDAADTSVRATRTLLLPYAGFRANKIRDWPSGKSRPDPIQRDSHSSGLYSARLSHALTG